MLLLKKYILSNKIISLIGFYFILSIVLKIILSIDILLPCIWKVIFNFDCPGCGLTRAFLDLFHGNIQGAFDQNPLIFIVLPAGLFYVYFDFFKFTRRQIKCLNK